MNISMKRVKLAITALALPTVAVLILLPEPPGVTGAPLEEVEIVYKAKCAICHAVDGSGNTANGKKLQVRDLRSAEVQKMSDTQLSQIIGQGKNKMPGYEKTLGKDKVDQLVAYTRELAKKH